ncbi:MAG: HAD family phosphatase [Puniceicoccales bacterium]|jgi:beta-phosphoglucomutase-like phosphatase (HAD superfamily)|nr:HAD family phosphatase [Puniceicoccales bacterium]
MVDFSKTMVLPGRDGPLCPPEGDFGAYIFDCDGTLAATMHIHYASWLHAVRRQAAGFQWQWEAFCEMGGMSAADTVGVLNRRFGLVLDLGRLNGDIDAFLETALENAAPCADAVALARVAVASGIRLAVASGGEGWRVRKTLRMIGVDSLFPVVVTADDVARVKPAPDLFLLAAKRLGVVPGRCLVIEDSPRGREAAEAAGMECLLVEPC